MSASRSEILASFPAFWRRLHLHARHRLWLAIAVLLSVALLEGSGLLLLVPLLHTLGLGGTLDVGGLSASFLEASRGAGPPLLKVLLIFVAVKTAQAGLRAFSSTLNLKIETDFTCHLRERFYQAMIQSNWLVLAGQRSSDLSQALLAELPMVARAIQHVLALFGVLVVALVQISVAVALSPTMTTFAVAAGALVGLALRGLRRRAEVLGELAQGKRTEMAATVSEHLAGMKIAKSHGRESQHFEHFRHAMREIAVNTLRVHRVNTLTSICLEVSSVLALCLFVYLAVGRVEGARLLVLVFVFSRLLSHSSMVQNLWQNIAHALPAFAATERLHHRLVAAGEASAPRAPRPITLHEEVRLENVSFSYELARATVALRGINLAIPARQVTALCGHSGAGKSTVADILLGLLSPTRGRVLLDGRELAGPHLHDWRSSVGYVPQDTFLFHETIRANLLWAQPNASEQEVRQALRAAAAEEFVEALPHGLDTIVGDRGARLSGGERQRIALARALLRRPTVLVLDEATSALDPHNERLVQDAIERLKGELTIVLIAHRLSTVRYADQIVVLDHGAVAETGTWAELFSRDGGSFRQLVLADTHL